MSHEFLHERDNQRNRNLNPIRHDPTVPLVAISGSRDSPIEPELWRPLIDTDRYQVSTLGNVRSMRADGTVKKILKGSVSYGYKTFFVNGKARTLHREIAKTFLGLPPTPDAVVRHLNDQKLDNRVNNLAWGTRHDNALDAIRNGKHSQATKTHCPRGHEYTQENTYHHPAGRRVCKTCRRMLRCR